MKDRERPAWLKVVKGGKAEGVPHVIRGPKPEHIEPGLAAPEHVIEPEVPDSSEVVRPLTFSRARGWKQAGGSAKDSSEMARESALVMLYLDLSKKPPANFERSVRPERLKEHAATVRSWQVDALHKYLSSNIIWQQPSFTKAVFEEINARMVQGNMGPRE